MALPNQPSIELPLLLELERSGGRVQKGVDFPAFYDSISKHFPDLTPNDRKILRQDGRTPVFVNTVEWARNSLRVKGELTNGGPGVWEITPDGKQSLRKGLTELGVAQLEDFIRSDRPIAGATSAIWRPKSLRLRSRGARPPAEPDPAEGPDQGQGPAPAPVQGQGPTTGAPTIEDELKARLHSLAPSQFEALVAEFLKCKGLSDIHVTGRSGDGGIDGEGNIPFLKLACCFQAKRWAEGNQVGSPAIRNFKGGMIGRYERGIFITSSTFSPGAQEEAEQPGATIILIDGNDLVRQLLDLGIGIKTAPVVQRSVDDDFFDNLPR